MLQETSLIQDQHRIRIPQGLDDVVTHNVAQSIGIPTAATENGLLAPRAGISRGFRPHPTRLAPLRSEQAVQEQPRRSRHAFLNEKGPQSLLHVP